MNKYKVKNTNILHDGKIRKEGMDMRKYIL